MCVLLLRVLDFHEHGTLYNNADDNTLSYADNNLKNYYVHLKLKVLFRFNCMLANTNKFKVIAVGTKNFVYDFTCS